MCHPSDNTLKTLQQFDRTLILRKILYPSASTVEIHSVDLVLENWQGVNHNSKIFFNQGISGFCYFCYFWPIEHREVFSIRNIAVSFSLDYVRRCRSPPGGSRILMKLVVKSKLRRELLAVKFIKSEGATVVII